MTRPILDKCRRCCWFNLAICINSATGTRYNTLLSMPLYGEGGAVVAAVFTLIGSAEDFSVPKLAKLVSILRKAIDECTIKQAPNEEPPS